MDELACVVADDLHIGSVKFVHVHYVHIGYSASRSRRIRARSLIA
jgi:hypothetical protein